MVPGVEKAGIVDKWKLSSLFSRTESVWGNRRMIYREKLSKTPSSNYVAGKEVYIAMVL